MSLSLNSAIPDGQVLFKYCYPKVFPDGQDEIPVAIFQDPELSCDWEKYRPDPLTSFHIDEGKTCVIAITVCEDIRNPKNPKRDGEVVPDWRQEIIHDPVSEKDDLIHGANEAHSLIRGRKKIAVCDALVANSEILIRLPEDQSD